MSADADLAGCAAIVARGDPERSRATMAAPLALRRLLLPLYAFNLEVARAPWVTREPLIAEIRLQWWRDALGEIAAGEGARRHEVTTPLAAVLDAEGAMALGDLVEARRADVAGLAIDSRADLTRYLDRTAGTLLWTAARLAGGADERAARDAGLAQGVAAWLRAMPALAAKGRATLPPGDPALEVRALAGQGLDALGRFRAAGTGGPIWPVFLVLADAEATLRAARRTGDAPPAPGPMASRLRLARAALLRRV